MISNGDLKFEISNLATSAQLSAPRSGIRIDFNLVGYYWAFSQYFDGAPRAAIAKTSSVSRIALAVARQSPQLLLHDSIFKRMEADNNKASVGL
jgi:hypothetical protein